MTSETQRKSGTTGHQHGIIKWSMFCTGSPKTGRVCALKLTLPLLSHIIARVIKVDKSNLLDLKNACDEALREVCSDTISL